MRQQAWKIDAVSRRHPRRAVGAAVAVIAVAAAGIPLLVSPAAQAAPCSVTVTLVGGASLTFTVDVPAGTPVSALNLPVKLGVVSVSESCAPATPPPASAGSSLPSPAPAPAVAAPAVTVKPVALGRPRSRRSSLGRRPSVPAPTVASHSPTAVTRATGSITSPAAAPPVAPVRATGGQPSPSNPTFSLALPGPAPLGVPSFFIDAFQIPPFLLPIYQAAGIEYDVPWQALAAINEIETDYGRNLSISSAGAVGWMQFLPSTWKQWGVDANGDGVADPYNPVDAIFTAARYLQAAGASSNLGKAIFAYNHAGWYVQSVLLRAKLIGGMPDQLIGALSGLVQGHFPVAARATYADDNVEALATRRVRGANAAIAIGSDPRATGVNIFAAPGSPVIAVDDGKITAVGQNATLGRYIRLQDATGNTYTYAHLGQIARSYPVPRPVALSAAQIGAVYAQPADAAPRQAASAGTQQAPGKLTLGTATTAATTAAIRATTAANTATATTAAAGAAARAAAASLPQLAATVTAVKVRLFAHPDRAASYAAGGAQQVASEQQQIASFDNYFSDTLHLARDQYTLEPLKPGAVVIAGTILARVAGATGTLAPHLGFQIRPGGRNAPLIDPKPILDGWKLLEATAVYRANGQSPFSNDPSVGQVLLMSKQQLARRVLSDRHVTLTGCLTRDIEAGLTDRRILAVLEYLSASGLDTTATALGCSSASALAATTVEIADINGMPVLGHQGTGSITDMAIRRLLALQGANAPTQIISLMSYRNQPNTLALPDHADRLQVTYTPMYGQNSVLSGQLASALRPSQWIELINRIGQLAEPTVPTTPSRFAINGR